MPFRRHFAIAALVLAACWSAVPAVAQDAEPIVLGDMNSYSRFAAFAGPYRDGWRLALDEINAAGGMLGRPVEVISRDDGGNPGDAIRVAEELISRENADLLMGVLLSNVGLAVSDLAARREVPFIAAEPLTDALTMEAGNRYTYRIRPNTFMQTAMLVDEAVETGATRWGIVAPNYEYGQSAADNFKRLLAERMPDAEVVVEQYPALGQIDAGATVQALLRAEPDALFNVLFGADLTRFVREGEIRGLFEGRAVVSLLTGEPEWLDPVRGEVPPGWIVTGYPWYAIEDPAHVTFREAYQARYDTYPRLGSLLGYAVMYLIRDALETAGSVETEAVLAALEDLTTETPIGPITLRAIDNQATMGAFVGTIAQQDGENFMVDWHYADGADYMFSEDEVRARRPDLTE